MFVFILIVVPLPISERRRKSALNCWARRFMFAMPLREVGASGSNPLPSSHIEIYKEGLF